MLYLLKKPASSKFANYYIYQQVQNFQQTLEIFDMFSSRLEPPTSQPYSDDSQPLLSDPQTFNSQNQKTNDSRSKSRQYYIFQDWGNRNIVQRWRTTRVLGS
eukprot:TRINITY_DN73103_c0_g1_i1.p2 TRINITY_DN73103_c0_g1~~TRINITY_DN73103_c0_g1_i1.p2  ORF type:complete len:102 (+),score=2.25 TRINITY_DN73103_c0_g1_i1:15-320(+)